MKNSFENQLSNPPQEKVIQTKENATVENQAERSQQKTEKIQNSILKAQEKIAKLGGIDAALQKIKSHNKDISGGKAFSTAGAVLLGGVGLLAAAPTVIPGLAIGGAVAGTVGAATLGYGAYKSIKGWWEKRNLKKEIATAHPDDAWRASSSEVKY